MFKALNQYIQTSN